jgi:hypothetical protein
MVEDILLLDSSRHCGTISRDIDYKEKMDNYINDASIWEDTTIEEIDISCSPKKKNIILRQVERFNRHRNMKSSYSKLTKAKSLVESDDTEILVLSALTTTNKLLTNNMNKKGNKL